MVEAGPAPRRGSSPRSRAPISTPSGAAGAPRGARTASYLAYVQGGPLKLIYYAGQKLAVVRPPAARRES